jgi:CheY-like chemotaxis protein
MRDNILVIDDSPEIHTLVKIRLGKELVVVHSAFDGATGLAMAREIAPDLILLDVDMPGRDGFAVCADLKADLVTMDTPIIFSDRRILNGRQNSRTGARRRRLRNQAL